MPLPLHANKSIQASRTNAREFIAITDAKGVYKFVADSVTPILGHSPEEMVGLTYSGFIHQEDQALTDILSTEILNNQVTVLPTVRFKTKAGEWIELASTVTNMLDSPAVQGLIINYREAVGQQKQEPIQEACNSLFQNHPDAVFELDSKGFIQKVNSKVAPLTGYQPDQVLHTHFTEIAQEANIPLIASALKAAAKGTAQYLEFSVAAKNDERTIVGTTILPVIKGNTVESILCIAKDISLHKQYDTYLEDREEQLNSIMELIPESFYTLNADWCFTYVNDFYAAHTGLSKPELLGKNIWALFPEQVNTRLYRECLQVALTGLPSFFEILPNQFNTNALSYHIFPTGKGVSVHFVDVSEKMREQDSLEKLSLVASKTTTCVMIMNAEKRIEWVNNAFEKVTGYTLSDVLNKFPSQVLAGEETSLETRAKINSKMNSGKTFRGEILNYTKNGNEVWFDLEITPVFDKDGKLSKYISIRADITDKKIKEEELMEVTRDLFNQNRDLQQFSYIVSHNLRAPASNLMGLANILSSVSKDSHIFDETLSKISLSAKALDKVVRDMNHILSVRENNYVLGKENVNLSEVCKDVLSGIQFRLRGFEYVVNTDLDESITLMANRVYLFEVLKNLFLNAIKFRKKHEVLKLEVSIKRQNDEIELILKDNGIGMDMDIIKNDIFKIYKKFHRGYEGQGLGLFLVKTYLEALGGCILVNSKVDIGTTFQIKFNGNA